MSKAKDITDQRFGRLTAVRPTEKRSGHSVVWECRCDCGNTALVAADCLKSGRTKSCGCLIRVDLTGQRFGQLTAVRPTEKRSGHSVVWECVCDCGNTAFVAVQSLKSGGTTSCGCLKIEDLTGRKFGRLTAVRSTEERRGRQVVWECKCSCGNTALVAANSLKSGDTKSCGCLKIEDLTGRKFGRLTAVQPTEERRGGAVVWRCVCDCGNMKFVVAKNLKSGRTTSCGCLIRERAAKRIADLTGQRFGRLTAVRPTEERSGRSVVWECVCDCGNTAFVAAGRLKSGDTKSCGCVKRVTEEYLKN